MSTRGTKKARVKKAERSKVSKKKEVVKERKVIPVEVKAEAVSQEKERPQHLFTPTASIPHPRVSVRHNGSSMERDARGYSLGELSAASVQPWVAKRWSVPVDTRRRSVVTSNVQSLKSWLQAGEYAKPASVRKGSTSKKE
ncbi:MAG: hypothetical protein HYY68_09745 [Thaumarchaeota archaeon]|nr:hypothetical protein [Nitrososphaerota archaeon]MBI3023987.1 hypothetical protein [Nitrososphaerota archaeon]